MVLDTDVRKVVNTLKNNYTPEDIAKMLDCNVESVTNCIGGNDQNAKKIQIRLRPLPELQMKRDVGRPKVFENRQLVEQLLCEHPEYTSIDVQRELLNRYGVEVSRRTLQRRISEIRARQFADKNGRLNAAAMQKRLEWAQAHEEWTSQDWRRIISMDDNKMTESSTSKDIYLDTLVGPDRGDCYELNLLEQLMDIIQPKIQLHTPKNAIEFRSVLYDIWHSDQELVQKIDQLCETMTWRVAAILQNGGGEIDV